MEEYLTYRERVNRLDRLERIAARFDSQFRMPLIGVKFGWDSILGLIPGVGDIATTLPSAFMIYEGTKMGVRRRALARMGANTMVDLTVGSIPVVGDLFDLHFKSHQRNVAVLRAEMSRARLAPAAA